MELEGLLRSMYDLLGKGELEKAVKLLDTYVFDKHTNSDDLIGGVIQLRRQYSTIQSAKLASTLMYDQIRVLEAQLTDAITIFLSKLRDYETNAAVRAERSGQGMLMHNIPQRMPIGLPSRCTIRIGAIKEALMKGMEQEEFAKVEQIKVSKLMEVQLLSEEPNAFDIKTVNRPEQEVDFDTYAQWRYDVTPLRQGQFNLTLKIATVKYIDGKDRYAEEVYDITVLVETRASHFSHENAPPATWKGVLTLGSGSEDKGTSLLDLLKENQKGAVTAIPPYIDYPKKQEVQESESWPTDHPKHVQPPFPNEGYSPPNPPQPPPEYLDLPAKGGSNSRLLIIIVGLVAVVALAVALKYYFSQPEKLMDKNQSVELKFVVDQQLQLPIVSVNGTVVKAGYDDKASTITVYNLTVGETYVIEAARDNVVCKETVRVTIEMTAQANPMQCKVDEPSSSQYELTITSPYPFETLVVDESPVPTAEGSFTASLQVGNGRHIIGAIYKDGKTICKTVEVDVQSDTAIKLDCEQLSVNSASYTVRVLVDGKIYKYSKALTRPMVDGKLYDIEPSEFVDGFAVFTIPNLLNGTHKFSLMGVSKRFACIDIEQDVQQDLTLRFDCNEGG